MRPLLEVRSLVTRFRSDRGSVTAVDGVSLTIDSGKTLGLVGESGCGKSVTSLSILRLIPSPPATIEGEILFEGKNLLDLSPKDLRAIRGNQISMIFQEPMTSLNPVFTIGDQISEVFRTHRGMTSKESKQMAVEMLRTVKLPSPERRVDEYPHQLSGGMRQRVMIAMALACQPKLLIADEPTTALDVTIQAQILDLISKLQRDLGMSVLLITHDLGVVAEVCTDVIVMYAGKIVEMAPVEVLFSNPSHPYTQGLLRSSPRLGRRVDVLPTIPGSVPSLLDLPKGCRFQGRCPHVKEVCRNQDPVLRNSGTSRHAVACWLVGGGQ